METHMEKKKHRKFTAEAIKKDFRVNKWVYLMAVPLMAYFISMVVLAGIIVDFTRSTGVIAQIVYWFTGERVNLLGDPKY